MTNFQKSRTSSGRLLSENHRLLILAFTFPISFILGVYGYCNYSIEGVPIAFSNALYYTVQLFIINGPDFGSSVPWSIEIARWLAFASTILVLINTILYLLQHESMKFVLKHRKNHTIVCGLGRLGVAVVEKLHESNTKIVAVDINPEPEIEERLRKLDIPLIIGDATRPQILKQARIEYSSTIFSLCSDDTINLSIALATQNINYKVDKERECFVHINDSELRNSLQSNKLGISLNARQNIHFIEKYGPEAIRLLSYVLPLDHDGIAMNSTCQVHLIILGFGRMGRSIAVKAAQLGHFSNRKRLRISVIDRNAIENEAELLFHHPYFGDVVNYSFYQQEILSPVTRSKIEGWCSEPDMLVNLVICFDNPSVVYDTFFNLLPALKKDNIRVAIRTNDTRSFNFIMKGAGINKESGYYVLPFGFEKGYNTLFYPEKNEMERFAIDIHSAYVDEIREELKNHPDQLIMREKSGELNLWKALNEDFKESNRQQAIHMNFKLRACGYEIVETEDPRPAIEKFEYDILNALSIMEHDRWVAERKINNWKYGTQSDKPNKINKNIIDWDQLADTVKGYDKKTVAMIPKLLKKIGKKMVAQV